MAFPMDTDKDVNNNNARNNSQFKEKLAKFVITGRYFASPIQFAQVINMICYSVFSDYFGEYLWIYHLQLLLKIMLITGGERNWKEYFKLATTHVHTNNSQFEYLK